jgi:hypothetical protein
MLMFPHVSQPSICPPKAAVRHLLTADKVRNCHVLSPKFSMFLVYPVHELLVPHLANKVSSGLKAFMVSSCAMCK